MKLLFSRTFWVFVLAVMCGGALLHISQKVQDAEKRLRSIEAKAADEREAIRVLNAEWEYLNSPARLEALADRYLDLVPPRDGYAALEADELPPKKELRDYSSSPFVVPSIEGGAPVSLMQPASLTVPSASFSEVSVPKVKPSPPSSPVSSSVSPKKNFNALLDDLNKGGR